MKSKEVLISVFTRMAAILAFAALCVLAILLSTGTLNVDLSIFGTGTYTARPDESGNAPIDSDTSEATAEETRSDGTDEKTYPGSETSAPPETSFPVDTGTDDPIEINYPTVEELKAKGYKGTYASWVNGMQLALLFDEDFLPLVESYNNTKVEETQTCITYQEDGIEFPSYVAKSSDRLAVEVYMGYILIDTGKGMCTDILPVLKEKKNESGEVTVVRNDRKSYTGVNTLTIFNSNGDFIGTYKADLVNPAYTRDNEDRALFKHNGNYYYIDETNGDFLLSDYIDEVDNRGLYFDYNPSYGKSDNNLNKYATEQEITYTYILDTSVYYTANQVDWRFARELILASPYYASVVAKRNAPFGKYYTPALKQIQAEEASRAAETSAPTPDSSADPTGTSETSVPTDTVTDTGAATVTEELTTVISTETPTELSSSESETLPVPPEETTVKQVVVNASPADISVPETLPLSPDDSTLPQETSSFPGSSDSPSGSGNGSSVSPDSSDAGSSDAGFSDAGSSEDGTTEIPEETTKDPHITLVKVYDAYRFTYAKTKPEVDTEKNSASYFTGNNSIKQNIEGYITWNSQFRFAKAFNFSGGRAVTVDDNGVLHIINTSLNQMIHLNKHYYDATYFSGYQTHVYYTEPFWKDVTQLGHYYYDNGLLRVRKITSMYNMIVTYSAEDLLIDTAGNVYQIPEGYKLYAYSEGMLILENNGLYGIYNKNKYWVVQPVYTSAQPFVEGLCVLGKTDAAGNNVYGMIDSTGNTVLPFKYKHITNASTGIIVAYSEETGWQVFSKMKK